MEDLVYTCTLCDCDAFIRKMPTSEYCKNCVHKEAEHHNVKISLMNDSSVRYNRYTVKKINRVMKNSSTNILQGGKSPSTEMLESIDLSNEIIENIKEKSKPLIKLKSFNNTMIYKKSKKDLIIDEIISTEKDYVNSLTILRDTYYTSFQLILSTSELNTIFSNLQEIIDVNNKFYEKLKEVPESRKPIRSLIKAFGHMESFVYLYATYGLSYKDANKLITRLKKENLEFSKRLLELEKKDEKKWGIQSYLIIPVQRVCRYPLLLKTLISSLDKEN
eukprot:TRINITY_DN12408_c0_g1_i1.p1 TRINITY_DN12408_c0_g1~~TRINITY_DN12408_c0_g1_i1.p1  ORF type:complete len:276 (-),score=32.35 TRINITY_DN12408_c0_g1_i1:519-1346(-)